MTSKTQKYVDQLLAGETQIQKQALWNIKENIEAEEIVLRGALPVGFVIKRAPYGDDKILYPQQEWAVKFLYLHKYQGAGYSGWWKLYIAESKIEDSSRKNAYFVLKYSENRKYSSENVLHIFSLQEVKAFLLHEFALLGR